MPKPSEDVKFEKNNLHDDYCQPLTTHTASIPAHS